MDAQRFPDDRASRRFSKSLTASKSGKAIPSFLTEPLAGSPRRFSSRRLPVFLLDAPRFAGGFGQRLIRWMSLLAVCGYLCLGASAHAADRLTLAWNPNTEENLAGYRLYYGTDSCGGNRWCTHAHSIFVRAPTTQCTVSNLEAGVTHYFFVTAIGADGSESLPSEEISHAFSEPAVLPVIMTDSLVVAPSPAPVTPPVRNEEVIQSGTGKVTFEADSAFPSQGLYNGLVMETDEVRHERSGNFTLKFTARGSYSGKLLVGGRRYSVKGLLDREGKATNLVLRAGLSPLSVEVAFDGASGATAGRVTGRVTDGTWTAQLQGDRQGYHAKTNPAPFAGSYTLVVPAEEGSLEGPQGDGYGTVKIDRGGTAAFVGMLADGTKATQKVPVSREGNWPFYLGVYKGRGSTLGWLAISNDAGEIGGLVSWIKPTIASKYYAGGLTNESQVVGSVYVPPSKTEQQLRRTELVCAGGNLGGTVTGEVMVLPNGTMMAQSGGALKIGVSPATGLFKGTVLDPATGRPRVFSGVVLQKWNIGSGLVLGTNQVGLVELTME